MNKTALMMSGGIDSTAIAFWKRPDLAITLNYGQKAAKAEIDASSAVCDALNIDHQILNIDCSSLGSGDMSNTPALDIAPKSDWWPFRNQMLITLGGMLAIQYKVNHIYIGTVNSDSYHKDGNIEFFQKMSELMSIQEGNISVSAPAHELSTNELIIESQIPIEILLWSHSCHKSNTPCGNCRGCNKYFDVISKLKINDDPL